MSSFFDSKVKCPKCKHTPINAIDADPVYYYYCDSCKYTTTNYDTLVQTDSLHAMKFIISIIKKCNKLQKENTKLKRLLKEGKNEN